MFVCALCMCLVKATRGSVVKGGQEPSCWFWEPNPGPLREGLVPSLQPLALPGFLFLKKCQVVMSENEEGNESRVANKSINIVTASVSGCLNRHMRFI